MMSTGGHAQPQASTEGLHHMQQQMHLSINNQSEEEEDKHDTNNLSRHSSRGRLDQMKIDI